MEQLRGQVGTPRTFSLGGGDTVETTKLQVQRLKQDELIAEIQSRLISGLRAENEALKVKLANAASALRNLDEAFCSDDYSSKEHREFGRNALMEARAIYSKNK